HGHPRPPGHRLGATGGKAPPSDRGHRLAGAGRPDAPGSTRRHAGTNPRRLGPGRDAPAHDTRGGVMSTIRIDSIEVVDVRDAEPAGDDTVFVALHAAGETGSYGPVNCVIGA